LIFLFERSGSGCAQRHGDMFKITKLIKGKIGLKPRQGPMLINIAHFHFLEVERPLKFYDYKMPNVVR
jgi:hypothetical protein